MVNIYGFIVLKTSVWVLLIFKLKLTTIISKMKDNRLLPAAGKISCFMWSRSHPRRVFRGNKEKEFHNTQN